MTRNDLPPWAADVLAGLVVLALGTYEAATTSYLTTSRLELLLVVIATAIAVGLTRQLPSAALALVWLTCGWQVHRHVEILYVEVAFAAVAFGTARWGKPVTVLLSGLSIPAAGILAMGYASSSMFGVVTSVEQYKRVFDAVHQLGGTWQLVSAVIGMGLLGVPWLAGLTVRFGARATESREVAERAQVESEQAHEIASLREQQARMARDVHDVVGHSLAVILAQAEAAQYLPDNDTENLKLTMATIATSARGSLQDVRQVLSQTQQPGVVAGGLDTLIEGVRSSGHQIDSTVVGSPQPMPPELEAVAFRVLQEMLTNALKYGRRDQPVAVERHWDTHADGDLRIEVRNLVGSPDDVERSVGGGQGLDGMRRRLEVVGGRLDVRRRDEAAGVSFTATAWIPVRPR